MLRVRARVTVKVRIGPRDMVTVMAMLGVKFEQGRCYV